MYNTENGVNDPELLYLKMVKMAKTKKPNKKIGML